MNGRRIFLSPPWTGEEERAMVFKAFDSGYVAPCGPMVEAFEESLARLSGRRFAVAVSGGTAALDLAAAHLGIDRSWTVVAPSLTFVATVGPAWHRGARLVFLDSAVQVHTHALDDLVDVGAEKVAPDAEPARKQVVETHDTRQENREHHHATGMVRVLERLDEYVVGVCHSRLSCPA